MFSGNCMGRSYRRSSHTQGKLQSLPYAPKAKAKIRDLHPTVKPMAMVRDAILDSSSVGEVVLDFFSGSGTTLIAAEATKRKGRVVELDPIYADTSVIRWQDYTGHEATLTETGETFAQVRTRRKESNSTGIGAESGTDRASTAAGSAATAVL